MKKKFTALLLALVMTLGLAPTTLAAHPSASSPGTLHHYNGHTYLLVEEAISPIFAEHFCDLLGGHLATITSEGENEFLCSLMAVGDSSQYYIGGTDRDKEGTWKWMNGESWDYANWYPGGFAGTSEPNNGLGRGENYVCADETRDWRWVDVYGGFGTPAYSFICEWDSRISSVPTTGRTSNLPYDKQGWHDSTCMVVNESVRPLFAQWYCSLVGGSLANVPASRQADFQSSVLNGSSIASYHLKGWTDKNTALPFVCQWGHVSSDWAQNEIDKAYDMDLVPDVLKDTNLTEDITRAEFAAVSVKVYESLAGTKALPSVINPFYDTNDQDVLKAYNLGVVNGVALDQFAPNSLLNREQAAAMLTRTFKRVTMPGWTLNNDKFFPLSFVQPTPFADDAKISEYARESVYFMAANGIIKGMENNYFAPQNVTPYEQAIGYANATREQALLIAVRMVENLGS